MGFLKKAVGGLVGGAVGGIFGSQLGALGNVLGGGAGGAAPQIDPGTGLLMRDVQDIRDQFRDREISPDELRQGANVQLDMLGQDRDDVIARQNVRRQGIANTANDQQSLFGGRNAGSNQRLAQQQQRQSGIFNQQIESNVNTLENKIKATDLGQQLAVKNQALYATPQLSAIPIGLQAKANAANQSAAAVSGNSGGGIGSALATGMGIFASSGGFSGMGGGAIGSASSGTGGTPMGMNTNLTGSVPMSQQMTPGF